MNHLDLLAALAGAQSEEDLDRRMKETVRVLGQGLSADEVRLYMIQLSTGNFALRSSWSQDSSATDGQFVRAVAQAAVRGTRVTLEMRDTFTAIPIRRGRNVPVVVVVRGSSGFSSWGNIETALSPLANVQLDRRSARVLEHLNSPLDYRMDEDRFYADLGATVLNASGMKFAALRMLRGSRLDCVAAWGFDQAPDVSDLSFSANEFDEFREAVAGRIVAVPDLSESGSSRLLELNGLRDVRAFVALPVQNSNAVFGVLTLATTAEYSFAKSELAAFEALSSSVSSAVSTYGAIGPELSLTELSDLSMKSTIETIAASARHSGLQLIDNAVASVGYARTEKVDARRKALLNEVEADLTEMHYLFERMKFVLKPPRYDWKLSELSKLWESAVKQFNARIRLLGIEVHFPSITFTTGVYPDWIRLVFIQLIINSVDAFAGKGQGLNRPPSENRSIRLEITPLVEERQVRLRYSDNAGGINPRAIETPRAEDEALPLQERIFRPQASSKGEDGSGWGLPLVRTAIKHHRGSVMLVENSRRGVTFDILLPIQSEEKHLDNLRGTV